MPHLPLFLHSPIKPSQLSGLQVPILLQMWPRNQLIPLTLPLLREATPLTNSLIVFLTDARYLDIFLLLSHTDICIHDVQKYRGQGDTIIDTPAGTLAFLICFLPAFGYDWFRLSRLQE